MTFDSQVFIENLSIPKTRIIVSLYPANTFLWDTLRHTQENAGFLSIEQLNLIKGHRGQTT